MNAIKNWLTHLDFDFIGYRRQAGAVSFLMVVGAWLAFFLITPNWGIDFEGGTEIQLRFEEEPVSIEQMRVALNSLGLAEDSVQTMGVPSESRFQIRIKDAGFGMAEIQQQVEAALTEKFGPSWIKEVRSSVEVGARFSILYQPGENGYRVVISEVRDALSGLKGVGVTEGREEYEVIVTVPGLAQTMESKLQAAMTPKMTVDSVESVGPKVGAELARQGAVSVLATLGLVLLYVAFRFDVAFAPGAILALFHDVSITVGIFVLLGREFNLPMIGALLTIVGYSLNDTIVIYDRIRENIERYSRKDLSELINTSINETIARTLATSVTTALSITAFLFLGGPVIQNFALAMLLGIVFGTYSTIFVASPMILLMQDIKPHLNKLIASDKLQEELAAPEVDPDEVEVLSQSEQRRRHRAALEKAEDASV